MANIILIIILITILYFNFQILRQLKVIAEDTRIRSELKDTIEKFAALAGPQSEKVVAFRVKKTDPD